MKAPTMVEVEYRGGPRAGLVQPLAEPVPEIEAADGGHYALYSDGITYGWVVGAELPDERVAGAEAEDADDTVRVRPKQRRTTAR